MKQTEKNGTIYLHHPGWDALPGLMHGLFSRVGGVSPPPYSTLNMGPFTGDRQENIRENLRRLASVLSISPDHIICSVQVHGKCIHRLTDSAEARSLYTSEEPFKGDGFLTDQKGLFLGILTADCLPVLLYDPGRPAVGAAHAGWRGTRLGISAHILTQMQRAYGSRAEDVQVLLGPAIGPCCYPVGEEVATAFLSEDRGYEAYVIPAGGGTWRVDLAGINRYQLLRKGVRETNIVSTSLCTSCQRDLFFSVRAQGEPTGRQISLIGFKEDGAHPLE